MKLHTFFIVVFLSHAISYAQTATNNIPRLSSVLKGKYKQTGTNKTLELLPDGKFILGRSISPNSHLVMVNCSYLSKGKIEQVTDNIIQLTSENYYEKEAGFKYELKKEKKWSKDSLYIKMVLPDDFTYYRTRSVNYVFCFNHDVSKMITSDSDYIRISKKKHLDLIPNERNHFNFSIDAKVAGTGLYKSRVSFHIFDEDINTADTNFITITLPNFDLCFFEFEPINHDLIYIKDQNELIWKGTSWIRQ